MGCGTGLTNKESPGVHLALRMIAEAMWIAATLYRLSMISYIPLTARQVKTFFEIAACWVFDITVLIFVVFVSGKLYLVW